MIFERDRDGRLQGVAYRGFAGPILRDMALHYGNAMITSSWN